jgi:cytochrome c peroxidase
MACAARALYRGAFRPASLTSTIRSSAARPTSPLVLARHNFRQQSRRGYSDSSSPKPGGKKGVVWGGLAIVAAGAGYYAYANDVLPTSIKSSSTSNKNEPNTVIKPTTADYQDVYNYIAKLLEEHDEWEDGSYGPIILRLGWHASGT